MKLRCNQYLNQLLILIVVVLCNLLLTNLSYAESSNGDALQFFSYYALFIIAILLGLLMYVMKELLARLLLGCGILLVVLLFKYFEMTVM